MDERTVTPGIAELLLILVRQRRVILAVYAGVLVVALVGVFLIPPQYRASAKVLLTTDRAQISTSPDRPTEIVRTNQVSEAEINSQLQIFTSREVVEGVLRDMGVEPASAEPEQRPSLLATIVGAPRALIRRVYRGVHGLRDVAPSSPLYWEVRWVLERLSVAQLGNSNVLQIALVETDPVWAADFVNRLTTAYVERHARMQQVTEAEDFFTRQSELLKQKLTESEVALRQLREKAGTLAGQQTEIGARLSEFAGELARVKIARAEQEERVNYLEKVQTSARVGRVATPELLQLEARRAELLQRYRPDSERVGEIDRQIQALRSAIASYDTVTARPGGDGAGGGTDLVGSRAALAALKGREAALERQREEYRQQAELLESQGFDLARMERQVKIDEEAYLSYVRTAEQSRLSNALEQSKILRLAIVEPAGVPLEPVSPNRGRLMLLALAGGLVVALGIGFARDQFNTTVKTAAEARRYGKVEVLATLPERAA
jgi:succinoglycan biosynthesis transport protein ExoP